MKTVSIKEKLAFVIKVFKKLEQDLQNSHSASSLKMETLAKIVKRIQKITEDINLVKNEKYETPDSQIISVSLYIDMLLTY